ncbi:MAG: hypothetical protein VYC32_00700 [Planctomycetota bacterium]|nr:hypothetical protein [Planctomycetota bacterium]MEC9030633.1 hypothetical protein [Planctomycetota bacterium]MEE3298557.1 hypothetical protein [Planctomycetota bacterium]|tara:strand:- start:1306 stop:2295 length:990 start_codon:yes stop_codon:yes gene_type:complete
MVRKIEKIEKEMGYCEIKLEKKRRLRRQVMFLDADLEVLEEFSRSYEGCYRSLAELPYPKIGNQVAVERQSLEEPGPYFMRCKDDFIAAGAVEMVGEEMKLLQREKEDIEARFETFSGLLRKRDLLLEEKQEALQSIAPVQSTRLRKVGEDFKKTEEQWHGLTEDSINMDEAIGYLSRNVDYLESASNFLTAAKGAFDVEGWIDGDYEGTLFRHSNIGRAREMVYGANRNLKLAQKELVCVVNLEFDLTDFEPFMVNFLGSLFHDIFIKGRLHTILDLVEEAIVDSRSRLKVVQKKREQLRKKAERTEKTRARLFQRIGGEKRGRLSLN